MNRYMVATGICYALSTPLGVHIGYLMGQNHWGQAIAEILLLMCIHMIAPMMWIRAQTSDIRSGKKNKLEDRKRK